MRRRIGDADRPKFPANAANLQPGPPNADHPLVQSDATRAGRDAALDFPGLLAAAKSGRPSAWDQLYRWLAPAVGGYVRLRGARDVDDLTSEVFLAVFRNIATFDGTEANFRSWVFVIAHRRLQDERRRRVRRPDADERPPPDVAGGNVEDDALVSISTERVKQVCTRLAPDQADVLLLRILGDLTVDQVADVLDKTPGAVKALQRRGFEAVRKILAAEGVPL
jgi:RNA polymerase sigma-70 factor (ECF subfamily)